MARNKRLNVATRLPVREPDIEIAADDIQCYIELLAETWLSASGDGLAVVSRDELQALYNLVGAVADATNPSGDPERGPSIWQSLEHAKAELAALLVAQDEADRVEAEEA